MGLFKGAFKVAKVASEFSLRHTKFDNDQRKSSEHYTEGQEKSGAKKGNLLRRRVHVGV